MMWKMPERGRQMVSCICATCKAHRGTIKAPQGLLSSGVMNNASRKDFCLNWSHWCPLKSTPVTNGQLPWEEGPAAWRAVSQQCRPCFPVPCAEAFTLQAAASSWAPRPCAILALAPSVQWAAGQRAQGISLLEDWTRHL